MKSGKFKYLYHYVKIFNILLSLCVYNTITKTLKGFKMRDQMNKMVIVAKSQIEKDELIAFAMLKDRDMLLAGLSIKESNIMIDEYNKIMENARDERMSSFKW